MSDRGAYRSTYEALADDLDFQRLSFAAQAVFHSLKLKLGQYGIAVFYHQVLHSLHASAAPAEIDRALAELEAPKPGKPHGWIRREAHVVWIVNGLASEPTLTLNNPNHRAGALRHARALPQLGIVRDFIAHYGLEGAPSKGVAARPSDPPVIPPRSPADPPAITETEREREREKERETESEKRDPRGEHSRARASAGAAAAGDSPARAGGAKSNGKAPGATQVPEARRLLRECYGWDGESPLSKRQREVARQLQALRGDGVKFRGHQLRAADDAHLNDVCRAILDDRRLRDPDKAIVLVIERVAETYTEALAAREQREREVEDLERVRRLGAANAWASADPTRRAAIEAAVNAQIPAGDADAHRGAAVTRQLLLDAALLQAWEAAGAPIADDVEARASPASEPVSEPADEALEPAHA